MRALEGWETGAGRKKQAANKVNLVMAEPVVCSLGGDFRRKDQFLPSSEIQADRFQSPSCLLRLYKDRLSAHVMLVCNNVQLHAHRKQGVLVESSPIPE